MAVGLAGHLAVQYVVLERTVQRATAAHRDWARTAADLHRLGVRPPCLLTGYNANTTQAHIVRSARRLPAAVLTAPGGRPPAYARTWPSHRVGTLWAYTAPAPHRSTGA